jgi:hypothetical protein
VVVLEGRLNGFPVIQTVSRKDADTAHLSTYVFDGRSYAQVSYALLSEAGMEAWHRSLEGKR